MDALRDVLLRLEKSVPDLPEPIREEVLRAGEQGLGPLLDLFRRRADETLRSAEEHHRRLDALIRRS